MVCSSVMLPDCPHDGQLLGACRRIGGIGGHGLSHGMTRERSIFTGGAKTSTHLRGIPNSAAPPNEEVERVANPPAGPPGRQRSGAGCAILSGPMPDKTPCRRCARVGYIRTETVVKGGKSIQTFYCGLCDSTWEVAEDGTASDDPRGRHEDEPPDRSRSR